MVEAAADIELFLAGAELPSEWVSILKRSAACLRRGVRACRHRQAYIDLQGRSYKPCLETVSLRDFIHDITDDWQMYVTVPNERVLIDPTLWSLILDNAIGNAFRHGHPDNANVRFAFSVSQVRSRDKVWLTVRLTNTANPARPRITEEFVDQVLHGEFTEHGDIMSDHIGLQQSYAAAEAMGMEISLAQSGAQVLFLMTMQVPLASSEDDEDPSRATDLDMFPANLNIYCLEDSASSRRLLNHNLLNWADTSHVHMYGQDKASAGQFVAATLVDGDIAILDQNLEYDGAVTMLGTDLVAELLAKGFRGLICIRSANVAPEDEVKYRMAGAHCIFGKDLPMRKAITEMKVQYVRRILKPTAVTEMACPNTPPAQRSMILSMNRQSSSFDSPRAEAPYGPHISLQSDVVLDGHASSSSGARPSSAWGSRTRVIRS